MSSRGGCLLFFGDAAHAGHADLAHAAAVAGGVEHLGSVDVLAADEVGFACDRIYGSHGAVSRALIAVSAVFVNLPVGALRGLKYGIGDQTPQPAADPFGGFHESRLPL